MCNQQDDLLRSSLRERRSLTRTLLDIFLAVLKDRSLLELVGPEKA